MARKSVAEFQINLNKSCYFAGEVMTGSVTLRTTAPIKCRSVQFEIKSRGYCKFKQGDEMRTHHVKYWKEERTLWGPYYRTDDLDNAGANAIWGSPWAPNGGVLLIPVEDRSRPLVVRVMDEDWGKRDDLLGEFKIEPDNLVAEIETNGGEVTVPLRRKGKEEQGTVTFTAKWLDNGQLRLEMLRAMGLRQADWFGKNDVYVQAYYAPKGSSLDPFSAALPEPDREAVLPPGDHVFQLGEFTLPDELPATFEGSEWCYVRYYAEANIDIKWSLDPFTRQSFTVMPRLPTVLPSLSAPCRTEQCEKGKHPSCYCPPFCCCEECACFELNCITQGTVKQESSLSGSAGAPGEQLLLTATAYNETSGEADFVVILKRSIRMWAEHKTWYECDEVDAFRQPIPPGGKLELNNEAVIVPQLTPSYHGGLLVSRDWENKVRGYGVDYPAAWWISQTKDPVVWWYEVEVGVDIKGSRFNLTKSFPFTVTSIPAAVISVPAVVLSPSPEIMQSNEVGETGETPPTYLPVKFSETVPITVVTSEIVSASWVPGQPVDTTGERDQGSNACSSLEYQPQFFTVPASAVTVVPPPV